MVIMVDMVDMVETSMTLEVDSGEIPSKSWKEHYLEFLVVTIQSFLKFLPLHSSVMDRLMEVIMLTLRRNVKHSTSALGMELEVWPSTVFCALMELCSTSSTLSVIGGSTLTAHWLSPSTP